MRVLTATLVGMMGFGLSGRTAADEGHKHGPGEKLGSVSFPVSCAPAVRKPFERAVALLHSFAYGEAEEAFRAVAAQDPSCAMAHWGVAMSNYHPIWAPPTPAELERGREAVARAKALPAPTARERDYVAAIETFYEDSATVDHATRALAYEKAMAQVHERHAKDREAAVFHALAILGNAPVSDKTFAGQKRAAAILNAVLPELPEHPGVAHYLIHSLDYPPLASLALPAARAYARIAPSAPHALHMPSHIFTRLGLWDESIAANLASSAEARRHVARTHPGASAFDDLHAIDYLVYAHLQQGRDQDAQALVASLSGVTRLDLDNFAAAYAFAAAPARYALERRQWAEAAALTVRPDWFPWARFPQFEALVHFARAVGAARAGQPAVAREALARLDAIHAALTEKKDAYWAAQVEIQRRAAAGWIAHAEGRNDEAVQAMRAAADLEDATDKHPVTPGPLLPAREMLADLLLELGRPAEAASGYQAVLATSPGRRQALQGAARAAEAMPRASGTTSPPR